MAEFSAALASRIEANPGFALAYANLQRQSLASLVGSVPELADETIVKLTQAAVAFSHSPVPRHRALAQDVAYALAACKPAFPLRPVWSNVLAEIGNFPAGDYLASETQAEQLELPWLVRLRASARRDHNTIEVLDKEVVLTDFQADIWFGLHEHQFLNVSAPTSAGKSFLMQTYLQKEIARAGGTTTVAYVVPSRALLYEVQSALTTALSAFGDRIVVTGVPLVDAEFHAGKSLVFVVTQERLQTILNESSLTFDLVIVDEAQQLADGERGILLQGCLEMVLDRSPLARLLFITPSSKDAQTVAPLLGLSSIVTLKGSVRPVRQNLLYVRRATGKGVARGLRVDLHRPNEQPLPIGNLATARSVAEGERLVTAALALGQEGQSIVYAPRPSTADRIAEKLAKDLPPVSGYGGSPLEELATFVARHIHPEFGLTKVLRHGIGVHYGRLPTTIAKAIEEYFDGGHIKYLVCTTTLLQGVNLPARNIFMRNPKKGTEALEPSEFWNLAGRAGRLKRDTHGNVFLVDYDDWEVQPVADPQTSVVEPAICEALSSRQNDILAYARDREHKSGAKDTVLAESVFSRLFLDARDGVMERTIDRALKRFPNVDRTELQAAILAALPAVSLPTELLRRNALISPIRQQRLYDYFRERHARGQLDSLVPVHPWTKFPQPKVRLEAMLHAIHVSLEGRETEAETFYGWFSLAWMRGRPLHELIDGQVRWHERDGDKLPPSRIAGVAREVMEDVEKWLRFHYVKYSRCYTDLLQHFLLEIGEGDTAIAPISL
ncbi:MAG: DEAD/DEAH box helicase, partial [Cupriavidus sp.]|nr:DEAD/DEAH box helicase [Cupriavidus sp.]